MCCCSSIPKLICLIKISQTPDFIARYSCSYINDILQINVKRYTVDQCKTNKEKLRIKNCYNSKKKAYIFIAQIKSYKLEHTGDPKDSALYFVIYYMLICQ